MLGLYHKLHGVHRPVAMKKSIIKRRKRVVPATQEQEANHAAHLTSFPVSASPKSHYSENPELRHYRQDSPSMDLSESINLDVRVRDYPQDYQHHYEPAPLGVDFTGYQIEQPRPSSRGPHQPQHLPLPSIHDQPALRSSPESQRTLSPFPGSTRKRSFSDAHLDAHKASTPENSRPNRLSSISSILNPTQGASADDMPIDPSLSAIGQPQRRQPHVPQPQQQQIPQPPEIRLRAAILGDPDGRERMERKARLRREAEQIRDMLKAKEKELEDMGEDD